MTKFYAIKNGRNGPIIYTDWASCEKDVKGFPNAVYKSFTTMTAATEYLKGGNPIKANETTATHNGFTPIPQGEYGLLQSALNMISMIPNRDIICYTDGACSGNNRSSSHSPCGCGVYIQWPQRLFTTETSKFLGKGTNNIGEMYGIKLCLETLIGTRQAIQNGQITNISLVGSEVYILTDSKYCVGILVNNNNVNANIELVNDVKNLLKICGFNVYIRWIPAHSTIIDGNEKANQLATSSLIK